MVKVLVCHKELGEDARAEDILKVLESIGTVALRLKMEEKEGPFGFNKNGQDEDGTKTETKRKPTLRDSLGPNNTIEKDIPRM